MNGSTSAAGNGFGGGGGGGGGGGKKSVEMDLQSLMMGSESLLTHIARPDGIPRLDKSLAEIVSTALPVVLCVCMCFPVSYRIREA